MYAANMKLLFAVMVVARHCVKIAGCLTYGVLDVVMAQERRFAKDAMITLRLIYGKHLFKRN